MPVMSFGQVSMCLGMLVSFSKFTKLLLSFFKPYFNILFNPHGKPHGETQGMLLHNSWMVSLVNPAA
jgi:hypothetical protein